MFSRHFSRNKTLAHQALTSAPPPAGGASQRHWNLSKGEKVGLNSKPQINLSPQPTYTLPQAPLLGPPPDSPVAHRGLHWGLSMFTSIGPTTTTGPQRSCFLWLLSSNRDASCSARGAGPCLSTGPPAGIGNRARSSVHRAEKCVNHT